MASAGSRVIFPFDKCGIAAQEIFDNRSIVTGNDSGLRRWRISVIYFHQHCDDLRGCLEVPADGLFKKAQQYRLLTTDLAQFSVFTYGDALLHKSGEVGFEVASALGAALRIPRASSFKSRSLRRPLI